MKTFASLFYCLALLTVIVLVGAAINAPTVAAVRQDEEEVKSAKASPPQPSRKPSAADAKPQAKTSTGTITLTAPQKRTRPGLAFVSVTVPGVKDEEWNQRVEVVWDVEAQWQVPDVEFSVEAGSIEVRDSGRRVQLAIPDSSGVVVVKCVATVDGKFVSKNLAKTYIEVQYEPRKPTGRVEAGSAAAAPLAAAPPAKAVTALFIIDPKHTDPNIEAVLVGEGEVPGRALKNRLGKIGVAGKVLNHTGASAQRYRDIIGKAGGVPCMVLVGSDGEAIRAIKVPAAVTLDAIVAEVQK